MAAPEKPREKFRLLNSMRIALSLFFLVLALRESHPNFLYFIVAHLVFSLVWILFVEMDRLPRGRWIGYIPATLDIGAVTVALLLTGHARSPLVAGYFGLVAISSTLQNRTFGLYVACLSVISYAAASAGVTFGGLTSIDVLAEGPQTISPTGILIYTLLVAIGLTIVHTVCFQFVNSNRRILGEANLLLEKVAMQEEQLRLRNAQMEQDLDLARSIHFRLLPESLPEIPGLTFATLYVPQDKVGGDLYDIRRNGDSLEIFVVDVSGHGVSSAFLAAIFRVSMESADRSNPAAFLSSMNEIFFDRSFTGFFLTAFYGVLDLRSLTLRFARAGHPHPLLVRNGQVQEVAGKGGMMGIMRQLVLEDATLQLRKGDRLMVYTDGIPEYQTSDGVLFGEENLYSVLIEGQNEPVSRLPTLLLSRLGEFAQDRSAEDDMTMVVFDISSDFRLA